MFVDPSGLQIRLSEEQYPIFLEQVRDICGNSSVTLEYTIKGSDYTITKINDYERVNGQGSELGRKLLEIIFSNNRLIDFQYIFTEKQTQSAYNSSAASMHLNGWGDSLDVFSKAERNATLVHEFTHAYTALRGYDDAIRRRVGISESTKYLVMGYQEATAITVENKFREEMGYSPRNIPEFMIDGIYGYWPHLLNTYPVGEKSRADKLVGKFSGSPLGISLMKSVYIWYDILTLN